MRSSESIGFTSHAASTGAPRLWGRDPVELHDHFWRQIGVTVVRPGGSGVATATTGPPRSRGVRRPAGRERRVRHRAFLLLGLDEMVAFAPAPALRRLRSGVRRASITVALHDAGDAGYAERIEADDHDRLIAVRRSYAAPAIRGTVLLTRDERLAAWWQRSVHPARRPSARTAVDRVTSRRGGRRRGRPMSEGAVGVLVEGTDRPDVIRWSESIMRLDAALAGTVPGVAMREPGVWVHETARLGPNVSLAGPLWIGENVVLEGQASIVGPQVLTDFAGSTNAYGGLGHGRAARRARRTSIGFERPAASAERPLVETRPLVPAAERLAPRIEPRPESRSVRLFNVLVSGLTLAAFVPILPLIMLAIWLEDGRPFFFGHLRQTRGGRSFTCWKFRTMCRNAERMKADLARDNVCDGPQFHIADDPRLLRVGRILRRFHLDEIPQLWNVLSGDMNLVGPRPSPDDENQYCPAWREARLSVKPGLTGLWQIRRTRAPMADFQEWIRWDLEYVDRRSWRLDLWIMWRTAVSILLPSRGGAVARPERTDVTDPLATLAGFQPPAVAPGSARPEPVAGATTPTAATAAIEGRPGITGGSPLAPARIAGLGLSAPVPPADDNARAVERAAADEVAATIARTTLEGDAAVRPAAEIEAKPRRARVTPPSPQPGDIEAKPAQPTKDPAARGDRDVEAKPRSGGDRAVPDPGDTFEAATGEDPRTADEGRGRSPGDGDDEGGTPPERRAA